MAKNSKGKHNVLISTGYVTQIEKLSGDQAKNLLLAICAYQEETDMPELDPVTDMLFSVMKEEIDENTKRYEAQCVRNRENGKKGGRPKKNQEEPNETQNNPVGFSKTDSNPKNPDSDSDSDSDIDNDLKEKDLPKGKSKKKKPDKVAFGEYQNVKLTMDEYSKLAEEYGETVRKSCITFLDEYIAEKGYKSKSHYLAIRRWVVDAVKDHTDRRKRGDPKDGYDAIRNFAKGGSDDTTGVFPDFFGDEINLSEGESVSG